MNPRFSEFTCQDGLLASSTKFRGDRAGSKIGTSALRIPEIKMTLHYYNIISRKISVYILVM